MIEAGANMNAKTDYGWTVLHSSAAYGNLEVVQAWIEAGADVNAMNEDDQSPLYYAAQNGELEVVRALIEEELTWMPSRSIMAIPLFM